MNLEDYIENLHEDPNVDNEFLSYVIHEVAHLLILYSFGYECSMVYVEEWIDGMHPYRGGAQQVLKKDHDFWFFILERENQKVEMLSKEKSNEIVWQFIEIVHAGFYAQNYIGKFPVNTSLSTDANLEAKMVAYMRETFNDTVQPWKTEDLIEKKLKEARNQSAMIDFIKEFLKKWDGKKAQLNKAEIDRILIKNEIILKKKFNDFYVILILLGSIALIIYYLLSKKK